MSHYEEEEKKKLEALLKRGRGFITALVVELRAKGHEVSVYLAGSEPNTWRQDSEVSIAVGDDKASISVIPERGGYSGSRPSGRLRMTYKDSHYKKFSRPEPKDGFKVPVAVEIMEGLIQQYRQRHEEFDRSAKEEQAAHEVFEEVVQAIGGKADFRWCRKNDLEVKAVRVSSGRGVVKVHGKLTPEEIAQFVRKPVEVEVILAPEDAIALIRGREPGTPS